jgi:hypothetical protein
MGAKKKPNAIYSLNQRAFARAYMKNVKYAREKAISHFGGVR